MALTDGDTVSLDNLKAGGALQLFQEELDKVLENIMDPNTEAEQVREVRLVVKIKPDKDRSTAAVAIIPSCKLAAAVALGTRMFFGKKGGRFLAWEHDPEQMALPMGREDVGVVAGGRLAEGHDARSQG
jgi:hypothetical protein